MGFISRASHILGDVKRPEDLLAKARAYGRASGRFGELEQRSERPAAEVNAGRWIVRCPNCANAMLADPDWPQTACLECGRVYRPRFPSPAVRARLEAILLERPVGNQHWLPDETVEDLERENREHGMGRV